jgi:hypothetical protein
MGDQKYAEKPDPTVTVLLDQGHQLQEEYRDVLDRRTAVRDSLRMLAAGGHATKEQADLIAEMFPPRGSKAKAA